MQKNIKYFLGVILIAISPVLFLYTNNSQEIRIEEIIRPLIICILFSGVIFTISFFAFKSLEKAFFSTSTIQIIFFFYGHLYDFLRKTPIFKLNLGRHSILSISVLIIFGLFVFLFPRIQKKHYPTICTFVCVSFSIFLIVTVGKFIFFELRPTNVLINTKYVDTKLIQWQSETIQGSAVNESDVTPEHPDIYLIILDMYGRQDALLDDINFDNSDFFESLRDLGFYIGDCSRSNYAQTRISISSLLNLNYIPDISVKDGIDDVLEEGINHSLVRKQLAQIGYQQVAFKTGFGQSEIDDAEYYFAPPDPSIFESKIQPFEVMLIRTTLLRLIIDIRPKGFDRFISDLTFPYSEHVRDVQNILDELRKVPEISGQKFVYAHILVPHPPYIFNEDGSIRIDDRYYREAMNQPISEEFFKEGYKNNVLFINRQILSVIKSIISQSSIKPIIILQADHGIRFENRMEILNSYYFPDQDYATLYPTISPVNTFRVIFNQYFGTTLPLLENLSFYSEYPERYEFNIVNERNMKCIK